MWLFSDLGSGLCIFGTRPVGINATNLYLSIINISFIIKISTEIEVISNTSK